MMLRVVMLAWRCGSVGLKAICRLFQAIPTAPLLRLGGVWLEGCPKLMPARPLELLARGEACDGAPSISSGNARSTNFVRWATNQIRFLRARTPHHRCCRRVDRCNCQRTISLLVQQLGHLM
jgi:hypothetical protein